MLKSSLASSISICIPACGRPDRLKQLLKSLRCEEELVKSITIVNTTPVDADATVHEDYNYLFATRKDLNVILLPGEGPAAARCYGSKTASSAYVLFLDEDLYSHKHNLAKMASFLDVNSGLHACSGKWVDHRKDLTTETRPLGSVFIETLHGAQPSVYKRTFLVPPRERDPVLLHDLQASILIRTSLLTSINFDPMYSFFLDLFDFFYGFYKQGFKCAGLPDVVFHHYPGQYNSTSQREGARMKKIEATKYFFEKWGVVPRF